MTEKPAPRPKMPAADLTGRIGKYDILRPLGRGAMGVVYLAHDIVLERDVALKVMAAQIADDPTLKGRFEREAKAVAKMTHPNVVTVFDLGYHTDGSPFIAMELLKGQDLHSVLRGGAPLTLERKAAIMVEVLAGLAHAHQAGIVHRDIKPANIFINSDGSVKIMDFGVARLTSAAMTGTGAVVGTADYMSPEQVRGHRVDGRSDLFSVGCLFYEVLTRRRPFHADDLMAIFYKITHEAPDWARLPEEAQSLQPILDKALAKNLEDRYQTAHEFANDLREFLGGHPSGAHALEALANLGPAPAAAPMPLTDGAGITARPGTDPTVRIGGRGGTVEPGRTAATSSTVARGPEDETVLEPRPAGRPGTAPPSTRPGTASGTRAATAPGTTRMEPTRELPSRAQPASSANPMLYVALGGLVVALLAAGGYIYWSQGGKPPVSPSTTLAQIPAPSTLAIPAPPPSTAPSPGPSPSLAPPPTFGEARGKAAAAMRAAQEAFRRGDYDQAIARARAALKEDPGNAEAPKVVENALNGQRAEGHFRAADAALRRNDYAQALTEAEAGRSVAPWDRRGPEQISRIQEAEQQAQARAQQEAQQQKQQQQATQVAGLLSRADSALAGQKYDEAIALYDEVLRADPQNPRAGQGKTGAVTARALSQAASAGGGTRAPVAKTFTPGKTTAQSAETASGGAVPDGFEDNSSTVKVNRGTQAADLPGKIAFDVAPDVMKVGEPYKVRISLRNEGNAPIRIKDMIVTTKINGRGASGPVSPLAREVAPRQSALLLTIPDFWKEDTTSWTMEVVVRTDRGETYRNQVTWK